MSKAGKLLIAALGASILLSHAAAAETTVSRTYSTDPAGSVVVEETKSVTYPAPAAVTTTTVRTTYDPPYPVNSDEAYFTPDPNRKGTYAMGEDNQGNNALRHENRTHDGYNN